MKHNICKIAIAIVFVYFSAVLIPLQAQNDLNVGFYAAFSETVIDASVLDDVFDTVRINGTVVTGDIYGGIPLTGVPNTVAGFGSADMVYVSLGASYNGDINQAQADALVDYVKQGGVLIMPDTEFSGISETSFSAVPYMANQLYCPSEGVNITLVNTPFFTTFNPAQKFHPGNGPLLFNANPGNIYTTASHDVYMGVPSEGSIFLAQSIGTCGNARVLEFIVPSCPGVSTCGVDGFAIFNGEESDGPLDAGYFSGSAIVSDTRNNSQINQDIAQLAFDFLYDFPALATRLVWASDPANGNTICPPTASCVVPCSITDPGAIAGNCTGTSNDLEFSLNLTGISTHTTYTVAGATPTTGTYGVATTFTIASGADGINKMITITDGADGTCMRNITITGALSCCDSGADAPRFLGLTTSTWMTIGVVMIIGVGARVLLKKRVF